MLTREAGLASHRQVDVSLLGGLLHELHHQLVRLAHHRRAVHADQLVARAQPPVLIGRPVLHDVADVYLQHAHAHTQRKSCCESSRPGV